MLVRHSGKSQEKPPKEAYNWKVFVTALSAAFGGILFGFDNAFLGGTLALPSFRERFGLVNKSTQRVNDLSSDIVITFQAGCFLACFLATPSAEILGRRKSLFIACVVFIVGAAVQLTGHLGSFYTGRFLTGLGVGALTVVCPVYVSEVAPTSLRGSLVGSFEVFYQVGGMIGFWINYGASLHISDSSDTQWRVPVSLQLPLASILLLGVCFLPETPRWLMEQDRIDAATAVLVRLRNLPATHDYVARELTDIANELRLESQLQGAGAHATRPALVKALVKECISKNMRHRISVGMITQLIGQLSGINGINYYSPTIFRSLGVTGTHTGLFATGVYGLVKATTACIAYFVLIERIGRRRQLMIGCVIMIIAQFVVGGYIQVAKPSADDQKLTSAGIAACAFIYIYVIGSVMSFGGIPWILSSECVPVHIRAISSTLGAATQWLFNLVITKATPYMIDAIHGGTFFFFGSCVVVGLVYIYFFVPETRGVPLERMAAVFGHEDELELQDALGGNENIAEKTEVEGHVKEVESI